MYACMDLGSNSFHLLIGRWRAGAAGKVAIVQRLSEKVQLGEGVGESGRISAAAWARGLACLGRFKALMQEYPLQGCWACGTNTFRVAANADGFLRAAASLGIDITVISGAQEAALIYAGVLSDLPESEERRLVIDVGGGSTEVIIGEGGRRRLTESLPIGSVAWRDRFFADQAGAGQAQLAKSMDAGLTAAAGVFGSLAAEMRQIGWDKAHASSGTMKMLAYLCQAHGYGEGQIRLDGLRALKAAFAQSIARGASLPGLNEARRDLLLPGWCVISGMMEACGIEQIRFSRTALREGMLEAMAEAGGPPAL